MNIDFNAIIPFLTSAEVQENLFAVRIGFFVVAGLLVATIIFILLKSHYLEWLLMQNVGEFLTFRAFGARRLVRRWRKIVKRLESGLESEYKTAVIEADDMLDYCLKRMGYEGQALEERLEKLTSAILPNIKDVHGAHQLRNSLVQDPTHHLSIEDAKNALDIYEKALIDLQILT